MGEAGKEQNVVSAVCRMCGRMQIDPKYYQLDGNAMTHWIVCKLCQRKQNKHVRKQKS